MGIKYSKIFENSYNILERKRIMNIVLIFFVLPLAVIILSCVLQRIIRCPILVAATFFAIFLILTYTVFGESFLIFTIIYTILSYISAILCECLSRCRRNNSCYVSCNNNENDVSTVSSEPVKLNSSCNCNRSCTEDITLNANVTQANSRCGSFSGCYRRR